MDSKEIGLEVNVGKITYMVVSNLKNILASIYFDIGQQIEVELRKIEATLQYAKGTGVLIETDSNSKSGSWHDSKTKASGAD